MPCSNTYDGKDISGANEDFLGNKPMNTIVGEQIVAERTDFVNIMFQYNISDIDVITINSGTGNTTHDNAKALVNTGLGVGRSKLKSKQAVRYITGHEVNCELTADFGTPESGVTQKVGIGDDDDGLIAFGYDGTVFGVWLRTVSGGLVHISQTEWNKDKLDGTGASGHTITPTSFNIYKITYGWYGILPITFSVYGGEGIGWVLCHCYDVVNETEEPHLGNPTLPVFVDVERTTGTGNNVAIKTSSWRGGIVGKVSDKTTNDRKFTVKTIKTISSAIIRPLYSLRSKATFQGRENHVRARIGTVTISTDGTKAVEFDVYKQATLTGGTWTDIDTDNSVMQYNNTADSITDLGDLVGGTVLGKVDRDRINLIDGDVILPLYSGEELHFTAQTSASTNEVILYFRHIEEF